MDKFVLVYGFDGITEGVEYFDQAEQALARVIILGEAIGSTFAMDAMIGVRDHGRFEQGGEWFELRNGSEYCSSGPVAING